MGTPSTGWHHVGVSELVAAPQTRAEWVDHRLRIAILSGELLPGARLRAEHLAAQWGVSPTPLREALQRLAGEGWVVIEPQRGARVASIDAREARELYELRVLLDPKALRSSMRAGGEQLVVEVDHAHAVMEAGPTEVHEALMAHRDFHLALLSACPNRSLLRLCTQLFDQTLRAQVASVTPRRPTHARHEHRALRDAVRAGDVPTAVATLTAHLKATIAVLDGA